MSALLNNPLLFHFLSFAGGILITLIGNYLKIMSDIAYIKGQISLLLKNQTDASDLYEKYATLDKKIEGAHMRLKHLEKFNGGIYGSSS